VTTLHEELVAILDANANRWMTTEELAIAVNRRGRYAKRDGSLVTAFQVHGRTRNYDHLFDRNGSQVRLLASRSPLAEQAPSPRHAGGADAGIPSEPIAELQRVLEALSASSASRVEVAEISHRPGLYAVHGHVATWLEVGLGEPPDERPLYVGKAEDSLASRDVQTHFGDGRTGSSTLRRSLAAFLTARLDLVPMPRNPDRPGYFASYGLEPASDKRLTSWMLDRLTIATWPVAGVESLDSVETRVLHALKPPLNLAKITTPLSADLSSARAAMANRARAWRR
jgi:hypothetical protein